MNQKAEYVKHHVGKDVLIEDCEIIFRKPMSIFVRIKTGEKAFRELFVPLSQVTDEDPENKTISITAWFADKEELV